MLSCDRSSVVEHALHNLEVSGSNPISFISLPSQKRALYRTREEMNLWIKDFPLKFAARGKTS